MKPGDRFKINTIEEVRDKKGRLLARYRPEFDYAVTPRNLEIVNAMEANGKAVRHEGRAAGDPNQAKAAPAKIRGAAKTGKDN